MQRVMRSMPFVVAAFAAALSLPSAHAATLPSGFNETTVATGLSNPTLLSIAPDGRVFVSEQSGRIRVIKNNALLATPFVTLSGVSTAGERGALGVAFDPNYASNRFVYVYWTSTAGGAHNQVSRFRASATNPDVAESGSETVIIRLPNLGGSNFHNGGSIHFGADGKLYISVGENNQSSRAQDTGHPFGKLLRINADGTFPSDNPYSGGSGQAGAIWARGFRNPFTFAIQPGTSRIFVNDVGDSASGGKEEVNNVVRDGNYNWPSSQGPGSHYNYTASSQGGCAITGGDFYNPPTPTFPSQYQGRYFFSDYCGDFIKYINTTGSPSVQTFATGIDSPTDVEVHPDGSLYYIARGNGAVRRVRFGSGPTITQQPQDQTARVGDPVTFTCAATGAGTIRYQWQKNNTNIAGATSSSVTVTAQAGDNGAMFRCVATDNNGSTPSSNAVLTLNVGAAPSATITQPPAGTLYQGGQEICYAGDATDPEDGTLPASAFSWDVVFHHDDHTHPHFLEPVTGVKSGCFTIPTEGEPSSNVFYRIHLTVTDSDAQTDHETRDVLPRKVNITVATNPPGLQVTVDGQPANAPTTFTGVVGIQRTLGTSSPQGTCEFQGWSDGGAINHDISTPAVNTTYTATFGPAGCTPNTNVYLWPEAESGTVTTPMQKVNDAAASGGQYVAVAAGNNSQAAPPTTGLLTIPFTVSTAGTYKVWGRVSVASDGDDSFWVRVDSGAWTNWNSIPVGTAYHWDDVHNSASGNAVMTYALAAGTHTLTFGYREDGTRLDRVLITNDAGFVPTGSGPGGPTPTPTPTPTVTPTPTPTPTGTPGATYLYLQGESATLSAPMGTVTDAAASGGQAVMVAAGNNTQAAPPSNGHAVLSFNVSQAGTYKVWGRVSIASNGDDSFWVRVDSGAWTNWNNISINTAYHWDDVHNADSGNAVMTYALGAGAHTLTVAYREDGARLDRVLITNDLAFTPSGMGP